MIPEASSFTAPEAAAADRGRFAGAGPALSAAAAALSALFWIGAFFAESQESGAAAASGASLPLSEKISDYADKWPEPAKLKLPKEISLIGGEADLSAAAEALKQAAASSHYDTSSAADLISEKLLETPVKKLCGQAINPLQCMEKARDKMQAALDGINRDLDSRILYPSNYRPPPSKQVKEGLLQGSVKALDSKCPGACAAEKKFIAVAVRSVSAEQYSSLADKIKDSGRRCQKSLLSELARQLDSLRLPKPCLEEKNKSHAVCADMLKNLKAVQDRVSDLLDMAYGPGELIATEAEARCVPCALEGGGGEEDPFGRLAASIKDKSSCLDLNPGEEKTIQPADGFFKPYVLKRDPEGGYSVDFPLELFAGEDYEGPFSKEEAPGKMRQHIQKCLAKASKKMLGPNGEKLKISISKPPPEGKSDGGGGECPKGAAPPARRIAISSKKEFRSNVSKYAADIDCPTVTHEILHQFSLCDEYEEKSRGFYTDPETGEVIGSNFGAGKIKNPEDRSRGFKPAFDCRVTAENSIMSDQYERWGNVFAAGKNKSLLTPGQFKAVLYGPCPGKNGAFSKCQGLAYKSSHEADGCLKAKKECERMNGLGGDKN